MDLLEVRVHEDVVEPVPANAVSPAPSSPLTKCRQNKHSRLTVAAALVAVSDVVDADPDREQRVLARPWGALGLLARALEEVVRLDDERARRVPGRDERLVDRRAADGVVVRQDERRVQVHRQVVDVVRAARRGLAGVRGVAERVARRGKSARGVEPAGGVRVTAAFTQVNGECVVFVPVRG